MIEHVAEIAAAYVGKNRADLSELPALIQKVCQSLAGRGRAEAESPTSLTQPFRSGDQLGPTRSPVWIAGKNTPMLKAAPHDRARPDPG
jgi:hypothetical protein